MEKQQTSGNIDLSQIKRGNFPGLVCSAKCPTCGTEMSLDFGECDEYIYYPEIGKSALITFTCLTCEKRGHQPFEWEVPFKIIKAEVSVEYGIPARP